MGWFYNPPPPSQGPASYTPPIPHTIQSPGDDPPRRQVQVALAMALVLASWPADLEPRLQAPNNERPKTAPFTLSYGDQPIPQASLSVANKIGIASAWIQTWGAQQAAPNAAWNFLPIPPSVPGTPLPQHVYAASKLPDPLPVQQLRSIVPTLPQADQPIPRAPLSPLALAALNSAWTQTWGPQSAPPLTQSAPPVSQPVPRAPLPPDALARVNVLWTQDWAAQRASLVIQPFIPPIQPPRAPLPPDVLARLNGLWTDSWTTQRATISYAAWFVPPQPPPTRASLHPSFYSIAAQWIDPPPIPRAAVVLPYSAPRTFTPAWALNANRTVGMEIEPE